MGKYYSSASKGDPQNSPETTPPSSAATTIPEETIINPLPNVKTAFDIVQKLIESEDTQGRKTVIAKNILASAKNGIMTSFTEAISALQSHSDQNTTLTNDL